jgi:ParB-like chromosome segregation protein Spo0J
LKVKISEIKICKRIRKDSGDIKDLAENIKEYGLLSDIILRRLDDDDAYKFKLLAGWRRIKAYEILQSMPKEKGFDPVQYESIESKIQIQK